MDEQQLARGLGWFSVGLGLMEVAAPRRLAQSLGLDGHHGLLRLFGLREIASGVGILSQRNTADWLWTRVGGDAMDLALLGSALTPDNPRRDAAMMATAAVAGVTALDVMCGLRLGRGDGAMQDGALHLERSITIDRPAEELYRFWRNFAGLPRIMNHLVSVREIGGGRWRWVAKAPAGRRVEWDAEITQDRPNELIAWRSLEGADVDNWGAVRFMPAPGGRGTVVKVAMDYSPPAGAIGAKITALFGESPEKQVAVDLQHFKQVMETGEIPTTEGQPAGRARSLSKKYDEFVRS
jgi:uncharacterized membrane protein